MVCEAIGSILSQDSGVRVGVADDGAMDGTPEVVSSRFGSALTLVVQETAEGGSARNRGAAEARTLMHHSLS
jgi:glycosyltransferase involved in cell wall biosynthesis